MLQSVPRTQVEGTATNQKKVFPVAEAVAQEDKLNCTPTLQIFHYVISISI